MYCWLAMCIAICEVWYSSRMDSSPSGSPAKELPSRNFLRRKTNISMAMPTLLTLYFLGAGIAFMVCTRTFLSFHIDSSPESQAPVQLPGHESFTEKGSALEVLHELNYQSPAHTLRDVRSVVISGDISGNISGDISRIDSENESSLDPEVDESEPEFMQKPVLRMNNEKAADLQSRLKKMTSWERKRWLTEHWSSFQILKVDSLSRQFGDRMQEFFCSGPSPNVTVAEENVNIRRLLLPESSVDQMDERKICKTNGTSSLQGNSGFCRQRFVLTWMSPVSSFGPRERLSLESIFKWHPAACVVILSRTMDSSPGREILEPFVARGYRVMAVTPDLEFLFAKLPAAKWLQRLRDGTGDPGCINLMQNLSNLVRLAALYKYGGIYLDTDVVVLKPFEELRNVVGAQSQEDGRWTRLNNAVLVFDRAHPVVYEFLREFVDTFDGSRWGWNGPYLVSRVVEKVVQVQHWQNCSSVSVLPPQAFYPVNWIDIVHLFQRPVEESQSKRLIKDLEWMRQGSYAIHLWNKKSNFLQVEEGSIMETLFKNSCLFCKPGS